MKKLIWGLLGFALICSACKEDAVDNLFGESPEHRVESQISELKAKLENSDFGWLAYYLFQNGNNDIYYNIRFLPNTNRVKIQYEDNGHVAETECSYTLRYTGGVELVFDTYSPFAMLVGMADKGDFRFNLRQQEDERLIFDAYDDAQNGAGILYLNPSQNADGYEELQNMRRLLQNSGQKSFYRLIRLDGSDQKYMYRYQVAAMVDYLENGEIKSVEAPLEVNQTGARLTKPILLEGHQIDELLFNEADDNFFVMEKGNKIGILEYTDKKPFVYPRAVKMFMDEIGADTSTIMIAPIALSYKLADAFQRFLDVTPDFLQFVIEPCLHWMVFFNKTDEAVGYRIDTEYGEDSMCFNWTGTAGHSTPENPSWSQRYYEEHAWPFLDEPVNPRGQWGEKYSPSYPEMDTTILYGMTTPPSYLSVNLSLKMLSKDKM